MSEQNVTFTVQRPQRFPASCRCPTASSPGERRPAFIVLHGFGSRMNAGERHAALRHARQARLCHHALRHAGLRRERGREGPAASASTRCRRRVTRSPCWRRTRTWTAKRIARPGIELRRRGRGLLRRRRRARRGRGLGLRLGPRRAEIPPPASDAGGLGKIHRHAGGRPRLSRAHRQAADGAALRHRADPGTPAHPCGAGLGADRSRGRPRRACTTSAPTTWSARSRRGRCCCCTAPTITSRRSSSRSSCSQHAGQPTELHLFADTDHFMFAEGNTRVHHVVQDWLANYFPVEAKAAACFA